jgi:hypothetical protein
MCPAWVPRRSRASRAILLSLMATSVASQGVVGAEEMVEALKSARTDGGPTRLTCRPGRTRSALPLAPGAAHSAGEAQPPLDPGDRLLRSDEVIPKMHVGAACRTSVNGR